MSCKNKAKEIKQNLIISLEWLLTLYVDLKKINQKPLVVIYINCNEVKNLCVKTYFL